MNITNYESLIMLFLRHSRTLSIFNQGVFTQPPLLKYTHITCNLLCKTKDHILDKYKATDKISV